MSELMTSLLTASRWLREQLATIAIVAGGLGLLGACLYRHVARPEWTASEALGALWPLYLAGALSLLLGWLIDWDAS